MPPALAESVSPVRVAVGSAVAAIALVLAAVDALTPTPVFLAGVVLLSVVVALQGVKPFGDTVAYHLLQAAAFAGYALVLAAQGERTVVTVVVGAAGVVGLGHYGRAARREGLWATPDR